MVSANLHNGGAATISLAEMQEPQPRDDEITLRDKQGIDHAGRVTCGTFSSIAVVLDNGAFAVGDAIEADYGGAMIPAVVRRAYRQPNGEWIVMLRWGQS